MIFDMGLYLTEVAALATVLAPIELGVLIFLIQVRKEIRETIKQVLKL